MSDKVLSWRDGIIRDGFTQPGYYSEVEGLHAERRFSFRPALPEIVAAVEAKRERAEARGNAAEARGLLIKLVADHLVSWDVEVDGQSAEISLDNVRRLRMVEQTKLYNIICGFVATEIDPKWKTEDVETLPPLPAMQRFQEQLGKS